MARRGLILKRLFVTGIDEAVIEAGGFGVG